VRTAEAIPVIGYLGSTSPGPSAAVLAALRQGLGETGWVEGRNLTIEYRWMEGRSDRLPALVADLVGRNVDVIVAGGPLPALALKSASSTIPIVFNVGMDPVGAGLVASFAHPGGNLTGVSIMSRELMPKRLELLSELVPRAKVIALLFNPNSNSPRLIEDVQKAAQAKGVELQVVDAGAESEFETAFTSIAKMPTPALLVAADPVFTAERDRLVALAAHHAVPAMYELREFAAAGGLISYGPNGAAAYRQVGIYAGRILKGTKPADLPVQQPTTFELVVNLKTAKALGLTVPPLILSRADEVIE